MTVLSYTNAFLGIPFPQHKSGQTATVQSYLYPGAVQPLSTIPKVLSYTNAFLGIAFPQHKSGQSTVRSFIYPGAVQPPQQTIAPPPTMRMGSIINIRRAA